MSHSVDSTVSALFYDVRPPMDFPMVVEELDRALVRTGKIARSLTWDCDDVAIFDLKGARIMLGWSEGIGERASAALVVSAGPGPEPCDNDALGGKYMDACRLISDRLAQYRTPGTIVWHSLPGTMTAERLDDVTEALAPVADTALAEAAGQQQRPKRDKMPDAESDSDRIDRLLERMERELGRGPAHGREAPAGAAKTAEPRRPATSDAGETTTPRPEAAPQGAAVNGRKAATKAGPSPIRPGRKAGAAKPAPTPEDAADASPTFSNSVPDVPPPMVEEMKRLRAALYPEDESPQAAHNARVSTPMRIAVGTMSATMVIAVAPVGAALLTYNALGGANMKVTGRAFGLTGAVLGLMQAPGIRSLLDMV